MPTPPNSSLMDSMVVDELVAQLGRQSVLELLGLWCRDVPPRVEALGQARLRGDVAAVAAEAHSIKGSSAMLGFRAVSIHCATLESQAKAGSMPSEKMVEDLALLVEQSVPLASGLGAQKDSE